MIERVRIAPAVIQAYVFSEYLNQNETSILVSLVREVKPKTMIEFGCNKGLTANTVLRNVLSLEKYVGIDVPNYFVPTLRCQYEEVPEFAGILAADPRFFLLTSPSGNLVESDLEPCDAVFIDGDHSYDGVTYDSKLARKVLRS